MAREHAAVSAMPESEDVPFDQADPPNNGASQQDNSGPLDDGGVLALDIAAVLQTMDTGDSLVLVIEGVPDGARLTAGRNNGDRTWSLDRNDLPAMKFVPPVAQREDTMLTVRVLIEDRDGYEGASVAAMFDVTGRAVPDPETAALLRRECAARRAHAHEQEQAGKPETAGPETNSPDIEAQLADAETAWRRDTTQRLATAANKRLEQQQQRLEAAAAKWKAEEARLMAEAAAEWQAEEAKRLADAEAAWKAEQEERFAKARSDWKAREEKRLAEAAGARRAEAQKRIAEAEARLRAEEEKRLAKAEAALAAEEQQRLAQIEAERQAEESKRLADFAEKWKAEEAKRFAEAEARWKKAEEERLATAAAKRQAALEKKLATVDQNQSTAEQQRLAEAEAAWRADEEKRLAAAQQKRQAEEVERLKNAAARWKKQETQRLAEVEADWRRSEEGRLAALAAERRAAAETRLAEAAAKRRAEEEKRLAEAEADWVAEEHRRYAEAAAEWQAKEQERFAQAQEDWKAKQQTRMAAEAAQRKAEAEKHLAAAGASWQDAEGQRLAASETAKQAEEQEKLAATVARRQKMQDRRMEVAAANWKAEEERRVSTMLATRQAAQEQRLAAAAAKRQAAEHRQIAAAAVQRKANAAAKTAAAQAAARAAARERRAARHAEQQQLEVERLGVMRTRWHDETDAPVPVDYQIRRGPEQAPAVVRARWKTETDRPFPEAYRLRKQRRRKPNEIKTRWRSEARKARDSQGDAIAERPDTEGRRASETWAKWQGQPVDAASGYDDGIVWRATKYGTAGGDAAGDHAAFGGIASDGSSYALDGLTGSGLLAETPATGKAAPGKPEGPAERGAADGRHGGVRRVQPTPAQLADSDVRAEILAFTEFVQSHGKPGADAGDRFTFETLGITVSVFEDIVLVLGDEEIPVRFENAAKAPSAPAAAVQTTPDAPSVADGTHGLLDDDAMFSTAEDDDAPGNAAPPQARTYDVTIPEADPAWTVAFGQNGARPDSVLPAETDNRGTLHMLPVRPATGGRTIPVRCGKQTARDVPIEPVGFDTFTVKTSQTDAAIAPASDPAGDVIPVRRPSDDGRGAGDQCIAVHGRPGIRTRGIRR